MHEIIRLRYACECGHCGRRLRAGRLAIETRWDLYCSHGCAVKGAAEQQAASQLAAAWSTADILAREG